MTACNIYQISVNINFIITVMTGLEPGIHVLLCRDKDVDARLKPGHDDSLFYRACARFRGR
jgi:hypothetical protein